MRHLSAVSLVVATCLFAPVAAQADIGPEVRAAAEAGDAESQLSLGMALLYGTQGVTADPDAAVAWLKKAAKQGNGYAQYQLGFISSDEADRLWWYEQSAKQGNPMGQFGLAEQLIYMTSLMSRYYPDAVEAMDLLHKSAAQDNPEAQHMLGEIYSHSLPSPALQMAKLDVAKAREWYARAVALGWEESQAPLDALKGKVNADFEPNLDIETFWTQNPAAHDICRQRASIVKAMREGSSSGQ